MSVRSPCEKRFLPGRVPQALLATSQLFISSPETSGAAAAAVVVVAVVAVVVAAAAAVVVVVRQLSSPRSSYPL